MMLASYNKHLMNLVTSEISETSQKLVKELLYKQDWEIRNKNIHHSGNYKFVLP